jgi:hypothetical protein
MNFATFTTATLVALALYTAQNLIRYLRARDANGTLGILLSWAGGLGVAEWLAHASVTSSLHFIDGAPAIGVLDFGSLLLLGLALGSVPTAVADYLKARDNTRSSAKPALIPGASSDGAGDHLA